MQLRFCTMPIILIILAIGCSFTAGYMKGNNAAKMHAIEEYNAYLLQANIQLSKDNKIIISKNHALQSQLKKRESNINALQESINAINGIVLNYEFMQLYNAAISEEGVAGSNGIHAREPRELTTIDVLNNVLLNAKLYYECRSKVNAWQDYYKIINN